MIKTHRVVKGNKILMILTNEVKKHQERGRLRINLKKCGEANNFIREMGFGGRELGRMVLLYGEKKCKKIVNCLLRELIKHLDTI